MIFDAINNKGKILITQKLKDNCNVQLEIGRPVDSRCE